MSGPRRVLIADNDESVLIELERVLEDAGFDTTTTWDIRNAVQFLNTRSYDFVLLGESFSGIHAERMLQPAELAGNTPRVVILSAFPPRDDFPAGSSVVVCKRRPEDVLRAINTGITAERSAACARAA
jgi:DNA-binding response OmpR family regulator